MAYFSPYIDETGFHMPAYTDIRDDMIDNAKTIFGTDIYLESDSQEYQWISVVSLKIYDAFLAAQAAYNSRSPSTAIGAGLASLVKLNGIKKKTEVYSTCYVTVYGNAGTTITDGVIQDINGYDWDLTSPTIIDSSGKATALATCQTAGAISANPGELCKIVTPTYGWTSVTNTEAATVGAEAETDAKLRSRQAISTAQPSRTVLEGIKGAIAAVSGVSRFQVYENDTGTEDANGLPAHSITAVVEGGDDSDIAQAIFNKKTPGSPTNGTTSVSITDQYGVPNTIKFYRVSYVDIDVVVNVKKLTGYTSQTTDDIKAAIAEFNNSLAIGDDLPISSLWGAALSANAVSTKPTFSITGLTAARHGSMPSTNDITIAFSEVTRGNVANITVNVS